MTFRVLSIDGGGMRGVYTAEFLSVLERSFATKRGLPEGQFLDVGKGFGLIVGTSTGAMIGCGLAKGMAPAEMAKLYREQGAKIFPVKMPSGLGLDLLKQLYTRPGHLASGDAALRAALVSKFGDTTLRDIWEKRQIALAIPAVNMATYRSWVFKTPHDADTNHRDDKYTLVDVCMASSAAPLFRSLAAINRPGEAFHDVFTDGGLWANNPILVALTEALRILGDKDEAIEIFALGSCGKPEGEHIDREDVNRGLAAWQFGGGAAKVSISAQEFAFDNIARMLCKHLKKKVRVLRFPSEKISGAMLQYLDLDETRPEGLDALTRQGRQDADMTNSQIQAGTEDGLLIKDLFDHLPINESGE